MRYFLILLTCLGLFSCSKEDVLYKILTPDEVKLVGCGECIGDGQLLPLPEDFFGHWRLVKAISTAKRPVEFSDEILVETDWQRFNLNEDGTFTVAQIGNEIKIRKGNYKIIEESADGLYKSMKLEYLNEVTPTFGADLEYNGRYFSLESTNNLMISSGGCGTAYFLERVKE